MTMKEAFLEKVRNHTLVMAVVGLGYVGLPLAVEKAKAGYRTIGFDIQRERVEKVNGAVNYIGDVVSEELAAVVRGGLLSATWDCTRLGEADFIAICVPTPLDAHQQPDISYVRASCRMLAPFLHKGVAVVLESTTYPGTTEELLLPLLEQGSRLTCSQDFYLGFSPERVDPGNARYKTANTPKVVGGVGREATEVIAAVYRSVLAGEVMEVSSPRVAEMEKILENTYRNINVGLANEMAIICHKMGINIWEVIEAAKTKPYGFEAFYPGPGLGGHCIPLDPFYLTWKAREYGYHTRLIELSGEINSAMPAYVAQRAGELLSRRGKPLWGASILLLGIAYKQDVADWRESPALKVLEALEDQGAAVEYYDPLVPRCRHKGRERGSLPQLREEVISGMDLVILTTAHSCVDYQLVARCAKLIFDTKNALARLPQRDNIVLL